MNRRRNRCPVVCAVTIASGAALLGADAAAAQGTCTTTLGIEAHGQHIVGDYVVGEGTGWPPSGGTVGMAVGGSGAVVPGGPGPGFHFPNGFSAGASFCLLQSQSPGVHLGP